MSDPRLQDVQEAVAVQTTVVNGVTTLLQMLSAKLKAAMESKTQAGSYAETMALIDAVGTDANALAHAVAANTPAQYDVGAGPPVPPPSAVPPPQPSETGEGETEEDVETETGGTRTKGKRKS